MNISKFLPTLLWLTAALVQSAVAAPGFADVIVFGDAASETAHGFSADRSDVITGGLGDSARRLLPPATDYFEGGRMAFTLKVDPAATNYATVRLWGDDTNNNRLMLFCEGKQIGYRHLGDIDILDFGDDSGEPALNGRFFYNTLPLPFTMTQGKTEVHLEVRSTGPLWGYGTTFEQYQKPMTVPSRGIYKIYSHTNGYFEPPAEEKQGVAPQNPPLSQTPGEEVFTQLKKRVNGEVNHLLTTTKPLNEMEMQFLAKAYFVKWTPAYQNEKVPAQVLKGLDAFYANYAENPALASHDPATPNPGWFEFGPAGDAIFLLGGSLQPFLDETITNGGGQITRRSAYSEMLRAGRDWHRYHRRLYSNQTMINDLYGIYLSNRGIEVVDPTNAMPEPAVRRYLYEALALEPWRDSDHSPDGEDQRNWGVGTNYWELTQKGLTRELGYVGYYGEVLDWVTSIYDATRPAPGEPGDEKIKAQLEKIIHARAVFRYPAVDAEGCRAMRIETIVGWRDSHYPGEVCYGERPTWDASPLYAVSATLDAKSTGYAQQMFDDNQFFALVKRQMGQSGNLRVTEGLMGVPDQYDLIKAQAPSQFRLPMTPGQPDFVFSDEEDGVVAIKNGQDILYVSLYWRARSAVNFLARVHYITPQFDRIGDVYENVQFAPSGMFFSRPDWVNMGFGNGGMKYPGNLHSAETGEKLPIAKIPEGVPFRAGDENVHAGKGEFYTLHYGKYLIAMNMTTDKTFELKMPEGVTLARNLVAGQTVDAKGVLEVAPRSTVVLYLVQ